ncbi:PKD domain-containing protein [Dyadobacter sp. NIV53]|uniref:PKD domain-containing protein n=1 Tax=Dyadobacter sp. NIV53 TaxID=2861765 RepID=UPI001C877903|nr:PKD domain-containing protein [Dyadobacter sp. NIV53]
MKNFLPFVFLVFFGIPAWAQIPVDFQFCTGTGELCVIPSDSTYELCLTLKPGFCASKEYEVRWGDYQTDKITLTKETTVTHVYDLRSFSKDCYSGEIEYSLNIKNVECSNDNKGYLLTFKKKPEAKPLIEAACEGSAVNIQNNSCPTYNVDFLWEFSDGQTSTSTNPYLSFTDPTKTYKVKLTATSKTCGSSTAETEFKLSKFPVAAFNTTGTTVLEKDTVVCFSGGAVITVDGSVSTDETGYQWEITGGKFEYLDKTNDNTRVIKIKLDEVKEYTITLRVNNACGEKLITRKYKVVNLPTAALTPQPDVCEEIKYKISNPVSGVTYTLNNTPIVADQEILLKLSNTPYIVTATINNACGRQMVSDTFSVAVAQPVKIDLPKTSIVCVSTTGIPLTANLPGGEWSTAGVETVNGKKVFVPKTAGSYTIIYTRGTGKCFMADTVKIEVDGIQATATDETICEAAAFVKLSGSPAGGNWTTSDCSNCIKGDTLLTSGLTASQITVTYSIENKTGCKATATANILFGRPKADFTIAAGCIGTSFKPVNNSAGANNYVWFVNDKQVSSDANPELLLSSGLQKIMLVASSGNCADTLRREIMITTPPPAVSFTPSTTLGCSPLNITFNVAGTATAGVDYTWDFGDNNTFTGLQPPARLFENSGKANVIYKTTLTAKNACGIQTISKEIEVRPLARAEIGVDSTTLRCTPAILLFSNRSSGNDKSLSRWLFGDGTVLQSGSDTVSHTFSTKDSITTFTVKLEITSECGRDTTEVPIKVYPTTVKALYTISKSEVCPGEIVQFTDASVPKPNRWVWKFGDGTISTLANPTHAFSKAKNDYKVTLIAYTTCGYDSTQLTVKTTDAITGTFDELPLACQGSAIQFMNKSDPQLGFSWDFGDGSEQDSVNYSPEHLYAQTGNYTVTLAVYRDSKACTAVAKKSLISVVSPAKASFNFGSDSLFCAPGPVSVINLSEPADTYNWYFSDGRTSDAKDPSLAFEPGMYSVKLVTTKGGVCKDSTERMAAFVVKDCQVDIPQAFTPNGDGMGDRYTLFGSGIQEISTLLIRNRWGEIVFQMKNVPPGSQQPEESWDGKFGGKEMLADMYVYETELIYIDQKKSEKLRGNIYLVR